MLNEGEIIQWVLQGPVSHRVYQRDEDGKAEIGYELEFTYPAQGDLSVRLISQEDGRMLESHDVVNGIKHKGRIADIPAGRYRMEFQLVNDTVVVSETVAPVFVGDLWILAGQSNMAGAGRLIDVEVPEAGVSCFYLGDRWDIATEPLCFTNESLDSVNWEVPEERLVEAARASRRDRTTGAGLGLAFAKELLLHTGIPIGLIISAHGGTSMADWDASRLNEGGSSHYGALIRKVRSLGGRVKGCLWYQGEADAVLDREHYLDNTLNWIQALRSDIGSPQLPVIYAQIASYYILEPDARSWNHVQNEQLRLEEMDEYVAMVPTIDASLTDMIHLDTPSLKQVGRRMAWQALKLAYSMPISLGGPRPSRFEWNEDRTELTLFLSGINGSLQKVERIFGFYVEFNKESLPLIAQLSDEGRRVAIRFEQIVPPGSMLWHGKGYYPTVNLKDSRGIPLVVFGPLEI